MQSCLGFYVDKNMIKYAKVNFDEKSSVYSLGEYGYKFYDNAVSAIDEICSTVNVEAGRCALSMANEGYHRIEVFSNLKQKDRNDLIDSEFSTFCESKGLIPSAMEYRTQMVMNTGNMDQMYAICAYTSKSELANINTNFEGLKVLSIAPIGLSIPNLFRNKGIDEEAAVVTIENKTTVTLLLRNEVQDVIEIPLGMDDILDKLAEKYNSYEKAYEACRKVSVYIEDVSSLDDESRDILDVVLPVFYDIRQRVDEIITPYKRLIKAVYLGGAAIAVNNVDVYFQESFPSLRCEILRPYFLQQKDRDNQNEISQIDSAIAIALNGLGLLEPAVDFHGAAKKALKPNPVRDAIAKLKIKSKIDDIKAGMKERKEAIKTKMSTPKRIRRAGGNVSKFSIILDKIKEKLHIGKKRARVSFDDNSGYTAGGYGASTGSEEEGSRPLNAWVIWLLVTCLGIFGIYFSGSWYVSNKLRDKIGEASRNIAKVNSEIAVANSDADYLTSKTSEYVDKINKLQRVMDAIATEKMKSSFDIPNFMSQVMFIVPQGVYVSEIQVTEMGSVTMLASSIRYSQLGYFVSRLKLEKVLENVDMEVKGMDGDIRILIRGDLP